MSLNCTEIEEIVNKIRLSGFVKHIFQPSKNSIAINIFDGINNNIILLDVTDKFNRICLIPQNEKLIEEKLRFSQLLNAQLAGARINRIFQFEFSRIVVIEFNLHDKIKKIVARLWGNAGNILFLEEDNIIIDCLKRFSKREEWPQEEFVFPEKKIDNEKKFIIRPEFVNDSINNLVYFYYKKISQNYEFTILKEKMENLIGKEVDNLEKQLNYANINSDLKKSEEYLEKGELIKGNIYKIKKGDKKVKVFDYSKEIEIEIEISQELTPAENVEKYFTKYKKIKDGIIKWQEQKRKIENKLEDYLKIQIILKNIDNLEELRNIERKINAGKINRIITSNKINDNSIIGRKFFLSSDYIAYVSRSSKEADEILKVIACGNDYWFHIRDYAGSHVVVKEIKNREITDEVKIEAATLALYYSKGRNSLDGDIYFTRVKYLHKGKGAPAGMVIPTREKNIKVIFDEKILEKISSRSSKI
jgi:predicted ribosome quality control (RQC) complex YloA/Tae2 family protein